MLNKTKTAKKLTASVVMIFLLSFALFITTFALAYSMVTVDNNLFQTGVVKINLNDEQAVINENEFLFEPGMTVKKNFFVENEGSCDIYYKLYFQNVKGQLADVLQIKICDEDKVLFTGTPSTLNRAEVSAADDVLKLGEKKDLQIYFYFPKETGNASQNAFLSFDLAADAVQAKNNTDKSFG